MKLVYEYTSGVTDGQIRAIGHAIDAEIARVEHGHKHAYDTAYAFAHAPYDHEVLREIELVVEQKQKLKPTLFVLVGIGGSSVGTIALYEAVKGTLNTHMRFICADTIGVTYTKTILQTIEQEISADGSVLVTIISKSGTTTESLVNAALIFEMLKNNYADDYADRIVIISDENSPLSRLAEREKCALLHVPQKLGGRYSVFSAVGLFPLAMLGVDIKELLRGARAMTEQCFVPSHAATNPAALSAAVLYHHYKAGKNIHDTFVFSPHLATLGAWYRQLMGESLGKQKISDGNIIEVGMTPTVSVATQDLHSVAQLYLAGPRDKITTMVYAQEGDDSLTVPDNILSQLGTVGAGKDIAYVHKALFDGVCAAYQQARRPYMTIFLNGHSAYDLGQFMQMKMFEIVLLGALLEVNPFDQPQVELYKRAAHALLTE